MTAQLGMMIYNCISAGEIVLALICISRVVYLEPGLYGRRRKILFAVLFVAATLLVQTAPGMGKGIFPALPICFSAVYMAMARKEKRIRAIFLTVPVLGFLMGIVSVFYAVPYTLTGAYPSGGRWQYVADAVFWTAAVVIYWKRNQIVHLLRLDEPYRKLGRWERNFLHAAGAFLFVIGAMLMAVTQTGISAGEARVFTGFGSLAALLLEISVVVLVWQGNQKDYYQYMTAIGEHYLQAELRHFRAYQERETRVRKMRHDMRNHLLCLRELAENGKTERIREYLKELSGALAETEQTIYSGNEIADAIISEKEVLARTIGARISLEGRLPADLPVKATDLCTIFANALDNALEAVKELEEKWIEIRIGRQNQMMVLGFRNPTQEKEIVPAGHSRKANPENHGFGILNITYAAEKYQGSVYRRIETENERRVYCLEVLLFLPEAEPAA